MYKFRVGTKEANFDKTKTKNRQILVILMSHISGHCFCSKYLRYISMKAKNNVGRGPLP